MNISKLNDLLESLFGIRISKPGPWLNPRRIRYKPDKPIFVEFIGGSCVGKTTLYRALLQHRTGNWIGPEEFMALKPLPVGKRSYPPQFESLLATAMKRRLGDIDRDPWHVAGLLTFLYKHTVEVAHRTRYNTDATVVCHDGILHNYIQELIMLREAGHASYRHFIRSRAVVHCFTSPEKNAERILSREQATGFRAMHHRAPTIGGLKEILQKSLDANLRFVQMLQNDGLPVIHLDTTLAPEKNVDKVEDFIAKLQHGTLSVLRH